MDEKLLNEIIAEAWAEYRYPRPPLDEPTEAFKRAVRHTVSLVEARQKLSR